MRRAREDDDHPTPNKLIKVDSPLFLNDVLTGFADGKSPTGIKPITKSPLPTPGQINFLANNAISLISTLRVFCGIDVNAIKVPPIKCGNVKDGNFVLPTEVIKLETFMMNAMPYVINASGPIMFECCLLYDGTHIAHANVCILDNQKKTFTHFEPHGVTSFKSQLGSPVRVVFKAISFKLIPDYEFIDQEVYCPDPIQGSEPYCAFWSGMYAYLQIVHPKLTTVQIVGILKFRMGDKGLLIIEKFISWLWEYVGRTGLSDQYYIWESAYELASKYRKPVMLGDERAAFIQFESDLLVDPESIIDALTNMSDAEYESRVESMKEYTDLIQSKYVADGIPRA